MQMMQISLDEAESCSIYHASSLHHVPRLGPPDIYYYCPACGERLFLIGRNWFAFRSVFLCVCGAWCTPQSDDQRFREPPHPGPLRPVYRFLSRPDFRDHFLDGLIRISSLQSWRNDEDATRRDEEEGRKTVHIDWAAGRELSPELLHVSRRLNIPLRFGAPYYALENVSTTWTAPNAAGLSFTRASSARLTEEFGENGVMVHRPASLFLRLTEAVKKRLPLRCATVAPIQYRARDEDARSMLEIAPQFIKDPKLAYQEEVRFLWAATDSADVPLHMMVEVGDIRDLATAYP